MRHPAGETASGPTVCSPKRWCGSPAAGTCSGDYGRYSDEPAAAYTAAADDGGEHACQAGLRSALAVALFNCTANAAAINAGGWQRVADRACPEYTPYTAEDYGTGACAPVDRTGEPVLEFDGAPALCIDTATPHTATFNTSLGAVRVALDVTNTPGTSNNFVNLARAGYYDGTLIHRSDPDLGILQGGSPYTNSAADPGPGYTLRAEGTGFTYRPGQLAMARRAEPSSAGGQYFFTVTNNAAGLDREGTYVVFGQVTEGLGILEHILNSAPGGRAGAPDPPVIIRSVRIKAG